MYNKYKYNKRGHVQQITIKERIRMQKMSISMYYILKLFLNTYKDEKTWKKNMYIDLDPKNYLKFRVLQRKLNGSMVLF